MATRFDSVRLFTHRSLAICTLTFHGNSLPPSRRDTRLRERSFVTFYCEFAKKNDVNYMDDVEYVDYMADSQFVE